MKSDNYKLSVTQFVIDAVKIKCEKQKWTCFRSKELKFINFLEEHQIEVSEDSSWVILASAQGDESAVSHEVLHAEFFHNDDYQVAVQRAWNEIPETEKDKFTTWLSNNYDTSNPFVVLNEFQSFTLEEVPYRSAIVLEFRKNYQKILLDSITSKTGRSPLGN